jgi:hypothetical protein
MGFAWITTSEMRGASGRRDDPTKAMEGAVFATGPTASELPG